MHGLAPHAGLERDPRRDTKASRKTSESLSLGYRAGQVAVSRSRHRKRGFTLEERGGRQHPGSTAFFFQIGFASDIEFGYPAGIEVDDRSQADRAFNDHRRGFRHLVVGEVAATHSSLKKAGALYKQTGIKYVGEHIIKKAGKAAAGAVGAGAGGKK